MTGLTERLSIIAGYITCGETMADVGTDHGFLPLYLFENGICPRVIMTDISKDSLQKAVNNMRGRYPEAPFDFRRGDGLSPLRNGEVDAVVIAGMGGVLMAQILGQDPIKTCSFRKFILQPRNGQGKLRRWLADSGFSIAAEALTEEGKFICEIIVTSPPEKCFHAAAIPKETDIRDEVPQTLLGETNALAIALLKRKRNTEQNILLQLEKGSMPDHPKIQRTRQRITCLEEMMKEAEK